MSSLPVLPVTLWEALAADGLLLTDTQKDQLTRFAGLIRQHGERLSLVSAGDLAALEERHLADSLGLAAVVNRVAGPGSHLDIGSGGGFPGIVLAVLFPERRTLLLERSERKAEFLGTVVQALSLRHAEVLLGEFPHAARELEGVSSVTARAVERPERLAPKILRWLPPSAIFVSQLARGLEKLPEGIVEETVPDLQSAAYRRGALRLLRRTA